MTCAPIALGDNVAYALALERGGVVLIDAGPDYDDPERGPTWEQATEQARGHGFGPRDVRAAIVTHGHIDHAGLAHRWAAEGARILAGEPDVPALLAGREGNERQREPRLAELRRHGLPVEAVERLGRMRGRRALRWQACLPTWVGPAHEGLEFRLEDGTTLRVLEAPGHTPGNLVAWVPERGELYSGDTLLPTTIPTPGLHFPAAVEEHEGPRWPSLPPFLRSVARLKGLGVRRVYPGHGQPVDDPARLFERWEEHHRRRAARVHEALAGTDGPDPRADREGLTAYEIARRLFARLPEERIGQAMTEVIGHLDLLEERGEARSHEVGGVVRYRLVVGG